MHNRDIYFCFCPNVGPPRAFVCLERKLQVLCCVRAHVGESFLYTCRSKDISIQNPCGIFSTPKVLHRSSKIHFPFKDEGAVWPVHVNTALCARIRAPQRRERVHAIGLCWERRWTEVTGRAGHGGDGALSCPLQPFKDNKPPRRWQQPALAQVHPPSKPHLKASASPLAREARRGG